MPTPVTGTLPGMPQATTDVRERIVDAAERCFARYGVGKTTVEDIVAAGLPRATVYRGFVGGRDQVILEVLLRDLRHFPDRLALRLGEQTSVLATRGSSCAALSSPPS
ncbi:MAG: TetR/AcrR family transcriptional regulator [Actinoallomurus sp.]